MLDVRVWSEVLDLLVSEGVAGANAVASVDLLNVCAAFPRAEGADTPESAERETDGAVGRVAVKRETYEPSNESKGGSESVPVSEGGIWLRLNWLELMLADRLLCGRAE